MNLATNLGVTVHIGRLPNHSIGIYDPASASVWISLGLTPIEQRSVLAHELGHAYHGHACGSPRAEREANSYAAQLLIEPYRYAQLEQMGLTRHDIAEELNVTEDVITAWQIHNRERTAA